ncbi:MAG: hypothetical protein M1816_000646 [Peltula sp. TS41687]|nr:MAG: hypothetical protein M1816_000646 [Peltula sp. TS41687]
MGNDGGSIPTRRELVKEAARDRTTTELKESQQEQQGYNWTTCPLSHRPLAQPIVSDSLGKLYNKDSVLQFLLPAEDGASKADGEEFLGGRIRSLKDAVEVRFEVDTDESTAGKNGGGRRAERWVCPVTRKALGPNVKSVYLVPCGHAFSESAVKEVSEESCVQCNEPFTADNIIPILPLAQAELERLGIRAKKLKESGLTHSLKKVSGSGKKRKKNGDTAIGIPDAAEVSAQVDQSEGVAKSRTPQTAGGATKPTSIIKDAATASLTAKVLEHEKERNKKRKLGMNDNLKALFSTGEVDKGTRSGDFMTRGYSIPSNARR